MTVLTEFQEKFKINDNKIFETEHWIWSLRPHQATIGAGILSLKRECSNLAKLKQEEFVDLNNIIKIIEPTLKKAFSYDVINYLMLMMFDKHIHYHILPRYEKPLEFLGEIWEDNSWPAVPQLGGEPLSNEKLKKLTQYIKSQI